MRKCKKLTPKNDYEKIIKAHEINNSIWNVKSSEEEFISRAQNGYLISVEENQTLKGTISAVRLFKKDILNNPDYSTWNGVTHKGTFLNSTPNGDTLCCVAITSISARKTTINYDFVNKYTIKNEKLKSFINSLINDTYDDYIGFIKENIKNYLNANLDPVINFHKKDKGIINGAEIIKIFPNGRKDDHDSLGFNILMQYPELNENSRNQLSKKKTECENMGYGKALILGALQEALKNKEIKYIMPYSRPAKYKYHLLKALISIEHKTECNSINENEFYLKTQKLFIEKF